MASQQHDEAFLETLRSAWIETRMEKDKTLLTLASGGVALIVALLTTVGPATSLERVLYVIAGASFIVAMATAIRIFSVNSRHIEDVFQGKNLGDDRQLVRLDRVLTGSFAVGVAVTAIIALGAGGSHMEKDKAMADEVRQLRESFTGIGRLQNNAGGAQEQKSLSGIGKLGGTPSTQAGSGSDAGGGTAAGGGAAAGGSTTGGTAPKTGPGPT